MAPGGAPIIGREAELGTITRFVEGNGRGGALVLAGEAGAGKTTLWEAGVEAARAAGRHVLGARVSGAETRLSFVTLHDLLEDVDRSLFDDLPEPQRRALDVALLEAEPGADPPELRAVGIALLGVLRAAAARQPLLVAIDDVQWLDSASADAIGFAARRLATGPEVLLLLAERAGEDGGAALPVATERIDVGALEASAIRRLIADRLGLDVPRHVLADVMAASGGNPLFALEVGRMLQERGVPAVGEALVVPAVVDELVGERLATLPPEVRRVVLAAALGFLRRAELRHVADEPAILAALDSGAVVLDGERVRLAHPLLGAAAIGAASGEEQRAMHLTLGEAAIDDVRAAYHLARAAERPDEALAARVEQAAARASARGAFQDAADLAEHALRLTPPGSHARAGRVLALGEHLLHAGHDDRLTELLEAELPTLPRGELRVRAHLLLNEGGHTNSVAQHIARVQRAFEEAGGDPVLAAPALADMATVMAVAAVERLAIAQQLAEDALAATEPGTDVERVALRALAWTRGLRGLPIDDLVERAAESGSRVGHIWVSLDRIAAIRLAWRGELQAARHALQPLLRDALEKGEAWGMVVVGVHLAEIELRAGDWDAAQEALDQWLTDEVRVYAPVRERVAALIAAGRGDREETERAAAEAMVMIEANGITWDRLEVLRARGVAALAAREPGRAVEHLREAWQRVTNEGVDEPGVFPVGPELVEALVELEDLAGARVVTERLGRLAEEQEHPWGRLAARRSRALLKAAEGEAVADELRAVAREQLSLDHRFDAARTVLALGRAERRARRWAAAREALEDAAGRFRALGSPGWEEQARTELERVGGRRPRTDPDQLTPAERRVVELAAEGRSNKAIAQTLVVSINTVEGHLTRAYAKLGVRSRAELATRFSGPPGD